MEPTIEDRTLGVLLREFDCDPIMTHANSHIRHELGLDDTDLLEFVRALEMEFGVAIEMMAARQFNTVGDFVAYIESQGESR